MRLYELAAQYAAIAEAALDDTDAAMSAALDSITDDLTRKVDGIVHVIADLDAEALALRAEEARLAERRRLREARVESLRGYLREQMDAHGITKIATATSTITVSDGAPRVVVEDEGAIPDEYIRTKKEIDKRAILDAMKSNGECVPGTRVERSRALRVK